MHAFVVVKVFAFLLILAFVSTLVLSFVLSFVSIYLLVPSTKIAPIIFVPPFILVVPPAFGFRNSL